MAKKLHNISDNDLAKFQGYLNEIKEAYTTDRSGSKDYSTATINFVDRLLIHITDGHKFSDDQNIIDKELIPMLMEKLQSKDKQLKKAEGTAKELLEMSRESIVSALKEKRTLLKLKS